MPNLTHVITTADGLKNTFHKSVLSVFGQQLTVIELLNDLSSEGPIYDSIVFILRRCQKVHTLKYCINYHEHHNRMLRRSQRNIALHTSVRNIVLRIIPWTKREDDDAFIERCLPKHFDVLTGMAFPALRQVVLEGIGYYDAPVQETYGVMRRRFPVQRSVGKDIIWEC
jgi:hypothetical protein